MKTLYTLDPSRAAQAAKDYRAIVARECFDGEIAWNREGDRANLVLTKGADSPVPVLSLTATVDTSMRRNWSHIRATEQHVYIIWLVRSGRLRMSHALASHVAEEGWITIFDSSVPFVSEALVDSRQRHNSIYAVVPAHLFRTYIPDFHGLAGCPFGFQTADGRILQQILTLLYQDGDKIDKCIGQDLLGIALKSLCKLVDIRRGTMIRPLTVREERLKTIESYIERNLTDSHLSASKVARALGITTRYMSYLLKDSGTNFTYLVNKKRQDLACAWLGSSDAQHLSIRQIAAMSGYKSLSQFDRTFRSLNLCTPTEFRQRAS